MRHAMGDPIFTPEELALVADEKFFLAKARIMEKVRCLLERVHDGLRDELAQVTLLAPEGFNPAACQFVKGEHLEACPYQYLDFPKHFAGDEKFTFRSLFWWGHHFAFALILEGLLVTRYKQNLLNRFSQVADREIALSLGPSLWDWKSGAGYTVEITGKTKSQVAAALSDRRAFKLTRFIAPEDPVVREGGMVDAARCTLKTLLPVITP